MALIDLSNRTVRVRIVYAGPAAGGKTTNLRHIASALPANARGALASIASADGRTMLRDDLPLDLGMIAGWHILADLASVPGQPGLDAERAAVLGGVDAVVFVADSDPARQQANRESMSELRTALSKAGEGNAPVVIQVNKQDLPNATSAAELTAILGHAYTAIPSVAVNGAGVFEALREACRLAVARL